MRVPRGPEEGTDRQTQRENGREYGLKNRR